MNLYIFQVSDLISVRLFSDTSAILIFRCSNHSVQLPLSALPYRNKPRDSVSFKGDTQHKLIKCGKMVVFTLQSHLQGKIKLTSHAGRDILLEREMNPRLKPVRYFPPLLTMPQWRS